MRELQMSRHDVEVACAACGPWPANLEQTYKSAHASELRVIRRKLKEAILKQLLCKKMKG
jgi:hypothetical protein